MPKLAPQRRGRPGAHRPSNLRGTPRRRATDTSDRNRTRKVAHQVGAYERALDKHPDEAKDFLESAIRWFFDQELVPAGYRAIQGFRRGEELDIITTVDAGSSDDWSIDLKVRRRVEHASLVLHLEVAYRSSPDYRKVRNSVEKLNGSIDQNLVQERGLPWTALVLLGPGWTNDAAIMQVVHSAYHERSIERVVQAEAAWWPFVDAVVMPGMLYKKHDIFSDVAMVGTKLPTMFPTPCAPDPLRPLAVARGFLMHRLNVLAGRAMSESEAWPDVMTAAISGSVSRIFDASPRSSLRVVLMSCHHGEQQVFFHMASAYPHAIVFPIALHFEDKTCTMHGRYSLRVGEPILSAARTTTSADRPATVDGELVRSSR